MQLIFEYWELGKPSTWYKATVRSSLQQQYNKEIHTRCHKSQQ